jgi:endonuclease/exonuclease/phosphatase (EEP) superfamily protein YafD
VRQLDEHISESLPPPAPAHPPSMITRVLWVAVWTVTITLTVIAFLRLFWHDGLWPLAILNALTPYLYVPAYVSLVLGMFTRRVALNLLSLLLVGFHVAALGPEMLPAAEPGDEGDDLKIVTTNLYFANQHKDALIDEIEAHFPDVIFAQELTPEWEDALERRGVLDEYGHGERIVREDAFGMALLSKLPIASVERIRLGDVEQIAARIDHDGHTIELLNVHAPPPASFALFARHERTLDAVERWARERRGPFVIAGDFNSTPFSSFSAAMTPIAHDGWRLAKSGLGGTAPNGMGFYPPVRIDRVFVSPDLTVPEMILGEGYGSDHKLLMARIARTRASRE